MDAVLGDGLAVENAAAALNESTRFVHCALFALAVLGAVVQAENVLFERFHIAVAALTLVRHEANTLPDAAVTAVDDTAIRVRTRLDADEAAECAVKGEHCVFERIKRCAPIVSLHSNRQPSHILIAI